MSRYATAFGREVPTALTVANPSSLLSPPFAIRLDLHDEELPELAETIRQVGLLQPIIARKTKAGIERVVGGRRTRAAKQAGLTSIPVIIRDMDDATAFEAQLIENLHHRGLTDYELGRAFGHMLKEYKGRYSSQEDLAKRLGKTQGWISQHITAYKTAVELKESKAITRVMKPAEIELLPEHQLRILHSLPETERAEALQKLIAERPDIKEAEPFRPSVRELEKNARETKAPLASVQRTKAELTCPTCHLTFVLIHKERRGGKTEHTLQQVIVA